MAWDAVNLRMEGGLPVSDAHREIILGVAEKAILDSDHNTGVAIVIRAVERVGRKVHLIDNLRAYASRAIATAVRRATRDQALKERPVCTRDMEALPDLSQQDTIEKQVMVRGLLETLPQQDREILLRKVAGETCAEIERDLNLKPRTAETRFRASKAALRQLLADKLDGQTRSRVG
jgi:DNA-directed RNA polymerase specialized sigma24 family protein